ncbi:MAG: fructose-1,6-bisphosphatase [Oscillospiraceae bacterium]|nr:fructose-1,6-bisphosphatase [Oscillospiraceae bacterium]
MSNTSRNFSENEIKYLKLLSQKYPTVQSASTEIINLSAILNLPKGTEHFMSDIHGEYQAFYHILNNASGAVKAKVEEVLGDTLSPDEMAEFLSLIYYPKRKLKLIKPKVSDLSQWYNVTLHRLIDVCRLSASKYTRSKVRKAMPRDFEYIIDELLHSQHEVKSHKEKYYSNIISTIIELDRADAFIIAMSNLIKRLVVDRLHIVGDIYDRGPRADYILDLLINHHAVDIQWGNHDVLWMGAAAGNDTCIANVIMNSARYNNFDILENGYGINLRPLMMFAISTYDNMGAFKPKVTPENSEFSKEDIELAGKIYKASAVILFKLEGQLIKRRPEFDMDARLLLDKIDFEKGTVVVEGQEFKLTDTDFPTIDPSNPYKLTQGEQEVVDALHHSFVNSERLRRHIEFFYTKGSLYLCCNSNLMFHGCVPMEEDGEFCKFNFGEGELSGKAFLDYADYLARQGFYAKKGTQLKQLGEDFMWFLWAGKNSPVFARVKMATFERHLIDNKKIHEEPKNPFYKLTEQKEICDKIFAEFGLDANKAHIINGHIPVKSKSGESPIKANGKRIVIDGGFCKAYQKETGIAGYTLLSNSYELKLSSHHAFTSVEDAIENNTDIMSDTVVVETVKERILVSDTDVGKMLKGQRDDLLKLLMAYRDGIIAEQ